MSTFERSDVSSIALVSTVLKPRSWCFLFLGGLFFFRSAAQLVFEPAVANHKGDACLARSATYATDLLHKISVQSTKPSHSPPIIRLPREFRKLAGSKAEIYETTRDGRLAFLVTADRKVDNFCATAEPSDIENCIASIESKTNTVLQLIEANSCSSNLILKKERSSLDLNPGLSLDRAFTARTTSKVLLAGLCITVLLAALDPTNIAIGITFHSSCISEYSTSQRRDAHDQALQKSLIRDRISVENK